MVEVRSAQRAQSSHQELTSNEEKLLVDMVDLTQEFIPGGSLQTPAIACVSRNEEAPSPAEPEYEETSGPRPNHDR